ncbi:MAG: hypothetical protein KKI08_18405 [Armatimonadetes bacterium]|nr:hypothetical protein [Armatimonadota bacterium]
MGPKIAAALVACVCIASLVHAEEVLQPLRADAKRGPNLIENPGFEQLQDGKPVGWRSQLATDWNVVATTPHGGKGSAHFTRAADGPTYWISQNVTLNQKRPAPLVVSGWSKAEGVQGARGGEYSVWVDLAYMDGTPLWGQKAPFELGTHDWQHAEKVFVVSKPVRNATVNVLFRNGVSGQAWFDDLGLQELEVGGGLIFDRTSATAVSAPTAPGKAAATLRTKDGLELAFDDTGRIASLKLDGQLLSGSSPGGFWVRNVAAGGPWLRPRCTVTSDNTGLTFTGEEKRAGLKLQAQLTATDTGLDGHVTLTDTTGKDRAITAYFVLPLADLPWTWHNDILHSMAAGGGEYTNASGWPISGIASAYPWCSLTTAGAGLAVGVPMDCPRVARMTYNGDLKALYVACDLGIVKDTINFPSQADFRFSVFRHDPAWGFRAATQRYYERHPQYFERRLNTGGIWMAFGDISKVKDWQDFGFAYDEHSATPLQFDNDNGIASFSYIEPMTYWLPMAKSYPRTYEGAMQALADSEASGKPAQVGWAKLTRRCGDFTRDQKYDLSLQNQAWCDGAVFTLNPDPNIPEDADCPLNKAHWSYSKAWADKHLLLKDAPRLDGIYIDSMPNWGGVRNWRREHWRTVTVPLTFDPDLKEPVLLQMFSTWQFSKWVADDVHARGGVMNGNGGALWPYFPALLDQTGQETGGILSPDTMAMARTLLRDKPYSPLLNTRFSQLPADYHVSYFHRSALYCVFPSYFNGDYFENGKWVIGRFFDKPEIYEPVRPLYKQFIPVLRRLYAAGWQPVTLATVEPAAVRVERYGPGNKGEALFVLYNPGQEAVSAKLTVPMKQLGLKTAGAAGLISGQDLQFTPEGENLQIAVPLAPDRCEVVALTTALPAP